MKFGVSHKNIKIRVSGLVVEENKILLVAHKKENKIYWLLPGGGVEYQELLDEALKREFLEELGINVNVGDVALIADSIEPHGKRHIINIVFWCNFINQSIRLGDEKILHDFSFKNINELNDVIMYPPLNEYIIQLVQNKNKKIYRGLLWIP